jgi:hypothetical protein
MYVYIWELLAAILPRPFEEENNEAHIEWKVSMRDSFHDICPLDSVTPQTILELDISVNWANTI